MLGRLLSKLSLGAAILLAGVACAEGPGTTAPVLCSEPVTVTVGRGTQPSLSWEPTCAVTSILVLESDGEIMSVPIWSVMALSGVQPPVRIGARPAGTSVFGAGATLTVGEAYRVTVSTSGSAAPHAGLGTLAFTARP